MRSLRYTGGADVRSFTWQDMQSLGAAHPKDVVFDKNVNHGIATMSNKDADLLFATGEFVYTGAWSEDEDDDVNIVTAQDLPVAAPEPTPEETVKEKSAAPKPKAGKAE